MKGFISLGTTIVIIYIITIFALAMSLYTLYIVKSSLVPIEQPVTKIMIISPSPVISPSASPSAKPTIILKNKVIPVVPVVPVVE